MGYLLIALIIDLVIGDPEKIPHPVVLIGIMINKLETGLRKMINHKNKSENKRKTYELISGTITVILITGGTYIITLALMKLGYHINQQFGLALHLWLISTTVAIKGLISVGQEVKKLLEDNRIEAARSAVGRVVGRDTEQMNKEDIIRAVVETLAENTSDGIIAPIFYYSLGGIPLAMTYKAINTLDSMLGYKNEKYRYFGRAAARLDDLANLIPARLTGLGFALAALITGYDWKECFKIMYRDAGDHPSWNAGFPEAAVAGALGLRLGGINYYQGQKSFRAYMGDKKNELIPADISRVIKMIYVNIFIFVIGLLLVHKILY